MTLNNLNNVLVDIFSRIVSVFTPCLVICLVSGNYIKGWSLLEILLWVLICEKEATGYESDHMCLNKTIILKANTFILNVKSKKIIWMFKNISN